MSHFSIDQNSYAKRSAKLATCPTSLSKHFLLLVPFLRYPDLISLVRYGSSVTLLDIRYFALQDWKADGDIEMVHIPGIVNPSDDLTKPLGWILHEQHCQQTMGHYQ